MNYASLFLCLNVLSVDGLIFKYIGAPFLISCAIILIWIISSVRKDEKVIAARGGLREMYAELFDAINVMPDSRIESLTTTSVTFTYRNSSNKYCKIELFASRMCTRVTFSILYQDKWIKTSKENFYGNLSGKDILFKIIYNFPDCDLSCRL